MALDLILFLVVVAGFFVIGLPLITTRIWMPISLEVKDVGESDLTDEQRGYFDKIDRSLAPLGFSPAKTYTVCNLQGFNLVRSYLSQVDPELVHALLLRAESTINAAPTAMNYLEVLTWYADGSGASTRNGEVSPIFVEPPHLDIAVHRSLHRPDELLTAHKNRTEPLRVREPRFVSASEISVLHQAHHEKWTRFQVERRALREDPVSQKLHPTATTGIRGISNFLNPFADNLTITRFFLAILIGLALPVAGTVVFSDPNHPLPAWLAEAFPISPDIIRWCGLATTFALLGLITGILFESKSFLWTFLLAWVPLRLLGPEVITALVLSLWAGGLAGVVCNRRMKSKALV